MKVDIDIESLPQWQQQTLNGFKNGELTVMMASRHAGKSQVAAFQRLWQDVMQANTKVTDIVLGEGTVYGSRYYTVEPVGGSWAEMEKWCTQVFGKGSRAIWGEKKAPEPALRWYANNRKFWFKSEKDRDWFIIKWRA